MSYVFKNKNNVKMQIVFDHPIKSLTQHILYILDKVYAHPNYTTTVVDWSCWAAHLDRYGKRKPSGPFAQILQRN